MLRAACMHMPCARPLHRQPMAVGAPTHALALRRGCTGAASWTTRVHVSTMCAIMVPCHVPLSRSLTRPSAALCWISRVWASRTKLESRSKSPPIHVRDHWHHGLGAIRALYSCAGHSTACSISGTLPHRATDLAVRPHSVTRLSVLHALADPKTTMRLTIANIRAKTVMFTSFLNFVGHPNTRSTARLQVG